MDDNCTTTSGSYSITYEDPPGGGVGGGGGGGGGGGIGGGGVGDFNHVQDVYV